MQDPIEYFRSLAQKRGKSDDEVNAFLKVLQDEEISKSVKESMMLRSDYSRAQDELKAKETNINAWGAYYYANAQELEDLRKRATELQTTQQDVSNMTNREVVQATGLTKEQVQDMLKTELAKFGQGYSAATTEFVNFVATKSDAYRERYGKRLDLKSFDSFMTENKITDPEYAYERFTRNDEESRVKKEREDWETRRTKEIEKEVRSRLAEQHPVVEESDPAHPTKSSPFSLEDPDKSTTDDARQRQLRSDFFSDLRNPEVRTSVPVNG